jgi:hypothetical protein
MLLLLGIERQLLYHPVHSLEAIPPEIPCIIQFYKFLYLLLKENS